MYLFTDDILILKHSRGIMLEIKKITLLFFIFSLTVLFTCESGKEKNNEISTNLKTKIEKSINSKPDTLVNIPKKDEDFGIVKRYCHPDPCALLAEYLERDSKGQFLKHNEWLKSARLRPLSAPAWDRATLIYSYEIDTIEIGEDRASFKVDYHKIADVLQNRRGPYLSFYPKIESHMFILEKTKYGWRISPPSVDPHILPESIIKKLPPEEKDSLRTFLSKNIKF